MMRQYLPKDTIDILNDLLSAFFKANSTSDNMAYALSCELGCPVASTIYHEKFAHLFPSAMFADKLSDIMIRSNARPVRKGFDGDDKIYSDIEQLFSENVTMMENLRDKIRSTIDLLDYDIVNKEIVVELETMLVDCVRLLKVSNIWLENAVAYKNNNNVYKFNLDFENMANI